VLRHFLLLGLLCLASCNDNVTQFVYEARIVDGDGGNPVAGTDATTLTIEIAEGELDVRELEFPITDGQFDASLEFASFSSFTRLRIDMNGPTTQLFTAPPTFVPSASSGFLRVVAAAPSSCVPVSFDELEAPRAELGMVQSGTFALVVGGTTPDDEQVEFFDALEWDSRLFADDFALSFLGATRASTVGEGQILVLPAEGTPFIFNMLDATDRITQVNLHIGAGAQSALVSIPGVGAMVIGGEFGGAARAGVTLVEPDAVLSSRELSEPRAGATAAALGQDVLVVGGNAEGNAEILLAGGGVGQSIDGVADGIRRGGLLVGDSESRALLLGGEDDTGAIRQDTLRFDGCPGACASSAGPTWAAARTRAIVPEYSTLLIGGDGSRRVEELRWDESDVTIEPLVELNTVRAAAGAIVYESGAFVVSGGDDGSEIRGDSEFCVPDALESL
jgi:hypothetical protein